MRLGSRVLACGIVCSVSGPARARCELSDFEPTSALPTQKVGQSFSFVATDDCDGLTFRTRGPFGVTKTPRPGLPVGPASHRYSVVLSEREWNESVQPADLQFPWMVVGTTIGGGRGDVGGFANWLDLDRDGWTRNLGDTGRCDNNPRRNPGMPEMLGNGIDDDCDGNIDNAMFGEPTATITTDLPTNAQLGIRGLAAGDVDGDGVADLAVPMSVRDGALYIVRGPATGSTSVSDAITIASTSLDIGWSASAGDTDADGVADLLCGNNGRDSAGYLFLGPVTANRDVLDADAAFEGSRHSAVGDDVDIVPDFDGDGTVDVVVGGVLIDGYAGAVYVASGSASGTVALGTEATYTFSGPAPATYLGNANFSIGDVSGDGIADLALAAPSALSPSDRVVYLVEGGSTPGSYDVAETAWASLHSSAAHLGSDVASGDYDGDGTRDVIVGDPFADGAGGSGVVYGLLGALSGAVDVDDAEVRWQDADAYYVGQSIEMGDVDGDEQLDVLLGAPSGGSGKVYLQLGPAIGVIELSSMPYFSGTNDEGLGEAIVTIADWDGDGGAEIGIAAPYAGEATQGAVYVFASSTLF